MKKLEEYVRSIPDFPQEGIIFRDVTSVLEDADGMRLAVDTMQEMVKDLDFDMIVGAESRGFIFGAPIAYNAHKPFALIRLAGQAALRDGFGSIRAGIRHGGNRDPQKLHSTRSEGADRGRPDRDRRHDKGDDPSCGASGRRGGRHSGADRAGRLKGQRGSKRVSSGCGDYLSGQIMSV